MTWKRTAAVLPSIGVALLPKLTCPICWPAYAGLLTTFGLGFLASERDLLIVTIALLVFSVAALAFRASERRGYGPAAFGGVASALIVAGKFVFDSLALTYTGIILLLLSSVWNSFPRRAAASCPNCVPS